MGEDRHITKLSYKASYKIGAMEKNKAKKDKECGQRKLHRKDDGQKDGILQNLPIQNSFQA